MVAPASAVCWLVSASEEIGHDSERKANKPREKTRCAESRGAAGETRPAPIPHAQTHTPPTGLRTLLHLFQSEL